MHHVQDMLGLLYSGSRGIFSGEGRGGEGGQKKNWLGIFSYYKGVSYVRICVYHNPSSKMCLTKNYL